MSNVPATTESQAPVIAGFGSSLAFEFMQRQAQMLASSALVPKEFSIVGVNTPNEKATKIANVVIALEMANRIGASPLMIMQNLYIVHGKPSWSSTFIIAAINGCGRFNAMKFEMSGEGDNRTCVAKATEKATGETLDSPPISIKIAKEEGWFSKSGSKWKTMPELMLRYRAATLFGRLYAPEILMGMKAVEEIEDIETVIEKPTSRAADIASRFLTEETTVTDPGEFPLSAAEISEVSQAEKQEQTKDAEAMLQEVFGLLAKLAKERGETPDDMIDALTKGRVGCQQDLMDKAPAYIEDIKLLIEAELAKEAE